MAIIIIICIDKERRAGGWFCVNSSKNYQWFGPSNQCNLIFNLEGFWQSLKYLPFDSFINISWKSRTACSSKTHSPLANNICFGVWRQSPTIHPLKKFTITCYRLKRKNSHPKKQRKISLFASSGTSNSQNQSNGTMTNTTRSDGKSTHPNTISIKARWSYMGLISIRRRRLARW